LQPSDEDLSDTIQAAQNIKARTQARLIETQRMIADGLASEKRMKSLVRDAQAADAAVTDLIVLQSWKSQFGRIFASSGLRIASKGCSLDWSLVEVNADRIGSNAVSDILHRLRGMSID